MAILLIIKIIKLKGINENKLKHITNNGKVSQQRKWHKCHVNPSSVYSLEKSPLENPEHVSSPSFLANTSTLSHIATLRCSGCLSLWTAKSHGTVLQHKGLCQEITFPLWICFSLLFTSGLSTFFITQCYEVPNSGYVPIFRGCPEGFAPNAALGDRRTRVSLCPLTHVSFFGSVGCSFVMWSQFSVGISVDCL